MFKQQARRGIMGKTKRRKQVNNNYSKGLREEPKIESGKISLGTFINKSDFPALTLLAQIPEFEKSKIIDAEVCVSFAIEDLKIAGLAFVSVNKDRGIGVGICAFSAAPELSKIETDKQKSLFPYYREEVQRLVTEAYQKLEAEIYQTTFLRLN
ncbi:hypothetical protein QUA35_26160 [Microcoleus sp. N9_B2]|uniref:hypothetical protein n=1 Tax=unclassified Microcoleus TaxID=2642155 RepID=UPI002FD5DC79